MDNNQLTLQVVGYRLRTDKLWKRLQLGGIRSTNKLMASHRRLYHKNTIRYHSEDSVGLLSKLRTREGAHSIQQYYHKSNFNKNTTDIPLNAEDISISHDQPLQPKPNMFNLPKINLKPKVKPTQRMSTQKATLPKQVSLFHSNKSAYSLSRFHHFDNSNEPNYGYSTHQGNRIKNQDRISIHSFEINKKLYQYFGVFDGHGGNLASSYLSNNLHILIKQALGKGDSAELALRSSLKTIEERFKKNPRLAHKSGSCVLVCLICEQDCWVANVGDSRMLSISNKGEIVQITRDHKPEDDIERKRIQYNGGQVYRYKDDAFQGDGDGNKKPPFRVYPSKLSVSRALGDIHIKKENPGIIIADADIYNFQSRNLHYLLLFSDGLYQTLSNFEISSYFLSLELNTAICQLFDEALKRRSQDNRSLIAIKLK